MQMLQSVTNIQLVSNPFLIATNKTPAEVSLGQTRRVNTAEVIGATPAENIAAQGNESANLVVQVTPQITSDGMIVMDLDITIDTFISTDLTSPDKNTKKIKTSAILANKQVLALGGLVRHEVDNSVSKVPILGDIPILGWFFKNRQKHQDKQNLLILVSARIVEPTNPKDLGMYNQKHIAEYESTLSEFHTLAENKDPIHRLFFAPQYDSTEKQIDDFLFNRKKNKGEKSRVARRKNKKRHQNTNTLVTRVTPNATNIEIQKPNQSIPTQVIAAKKPERASAHVITSTNQKPIQKTIVTTPQPKTSDKPKSIIVHKAHVTEPSSSPTTLGTKQRKNLSISDMLHNSASKVAAT
jgi:hypothetical protein